ncbi:ABC transporter ATP-binding protein [Phytomonospora endophytica]|uniref:Iron complex transport system ATP-binding protein n=1 Tax=Phytomonospora endophytica TaxID=714109 RepID=A0A841FJQ6_9ACTN|nr:ABC transporter ATP-binding protein [Phytomonospora endophytica]MBB6036416.1 iron complex transport system ATP-binding protein [Phytomonospora endophytica]GIG65739.1 ABC transporter ATP-binding protein [Phytomonospora endophytica]
MDLRLDGISVGAIVRDLSLRVPAGRIVGLVGPNGSGKTTALRCVYRALRPTTGTVWLGDADLTAMRPRRSARHVAALTQESHDIPDFTVAELVALGRAPHGDGRSTKDGEACAAAMAEADVAHLADRHVNGLSGGERQRVLLARALAQEPEVLVLDEPTNHLDLRHQIALLSLLRNGKRTVLLVLHDLNLAAAACDRVAVLRDGALVASGTPAEVLTTELVREVFGVEAVVVAHPVTGGPHLLYSLEGDPS